MEQNQKYFPDGAELTGRSKTLLAEMYGNRFKVDQTLYEYLIEFLLVFCSSKNVADESSDGKFRFHDLDSEKELEYRVEPRMGLKRFIFFDKEKKSENIEIDKNAYERLKDILINSFEDMEEENADRCIEGLQDLFHGYAVVIKKRSWCAQVMLPICPEVVFCEAMPETRERRKLSVEILNDTEIEERKKVDAGFVFNKRNFLARGGEIYYLHILQGMQADSMKKQKLERLLSYLLCIQGKKVSTVASFIQNAWEQDMGFSGELTENFRLSCIPKNAYVDIAGFTVEEMINFLSCDMQQIKKIELMAKGVMLQIMRMLFKRTVNYVGDEEATWIVDMGGTSANIIKKIAARGFKRIEEDFAAALNNISYEWKSDIDERTRVDKVREARRNSLDIFRAKGKELQCIIPVSGPYERFTLSEDCVRFLVLALIKPREKMTYDMFLHKLYESYRIVIGPMEYQRIYKSENDVSLTSPFIENSNAFQSFLKATGFLRELSDATSIVENPYESVKLGDGED